jgi:hypothetical protein
MRRVIILLAGIVPAVFGQDTKPDPGMMQADTAFIQAIAKADKSALEKLLDANFTWTSASGNAQTKSQALLDPPASAIADTKNAELKSYMYGDLGNIQVNLGRIHVLRVWVKQSSGWKAIVYQELMSLETPPSFTPGAGKDCENPCKTIAFTPKSETERQVAIAYSKLETAAHARNSAAFGPMVGSEFVAASSNSDKLQSKRSQMQDSTVPKMAASRLLRCCPPGCLLSVTRV